MIGVGSAFGEDVPDEHVTFVRRSDGTYRLFVAAGGSLGTYGFASPDLVSLTSLATTSSGAPVGVFLPSGPGTTAFDADYVGAGNVFAAANGTDLLMVYHAENHLFNGVLTSGNPFYAGIGLARSTDGGTTWARQGEIVAAHDPQVPTMASGGAGAATPSVVASGGYLYLMYRELDPTTNVNGFALARAPIASDGMPGSWQKYFGGAFSTAGLGGAFTPLAIVLDPSVAGDMRQPDVSYNTALGQFVMVCVGNGGIYEQTSPDLLHWTAGAVIVPAPVPDATVTFTGQPFNWYPALLSLDQPSDQTTDATGYLYYAAGPGTGSRHFLSRRSFTIVGR